MESGIFQFLIAGMGAGTTVIGGFFALMKMFIKTAEKSQATFLEHLAKKNGHTERIANEFSDTVNKHNEALAALQRVTERSVEVYERIERFMDKSV